VCRLPGNAPERSRTRVLSVTSRPPTTRPENHLTALNERGRAFQARAAATGNARSPSVVRPVDGTTRVGVEADRR